jgi:hypothetical protein
MSPLFRVSGHGRMIGFPDRSGGDRRAKRGERRLRNDPNQAMRPMRLLFALGLTLFLGACASTTSQPEAQAFDPLRARALTLSLLPGSVSDRAGWATDVVASFSALQLPATAEHLCAVLAITEQESGYAVDPVVPGLSRIAWEQIDDRAARLHLPRALVRNALRVGSSDGRSFRERIDAARTERELSEIYEDMIAMLPLGSRLFADRNPVRTGGPMQVAIAFAETFATDHLYPYPVERSIRREVFTRRGGVFFGTAHLLAFEADYPEMRFRFADFNAGHYASRNAAFQRALSAVAGIPLDADGDLLKPGADIDQPGATELAARVLGQRWDLGDAADIRRDLARGHEPDFSRTALYHAVFERADALQQQALPRAAIPQIRLRSPKITRALTTEWFVSRVQSRYERCLQRRPTA